MVSGSPAMDIETVTGVWSFLRAAPLAAAAGWAAARLLDPSAGTRGLALLCGVLGLPAGSWLWAAGGWDSGPVVAGLPVVPTFLGALAVSAVLKLAVLGVAGSR